MASAGRDGVHEQTGSSSHSISSSSSGTIVSITNTSTTSRLSCGNLSVEAILHLDLGLHEETEVGNSSEKWRLKHIQCLVQEFFGAPSANGGDISVLERWLKELGVAWVLQVTDGASASAGDLESWIQALAKIMESLRCYVSLFEEEHEAGSSIPDLFQFAQFMQETMLRMLAFVDVMVALDPNGVPLPALQHKFSILLDVRSALSKASSDIEGSLLSTPSPEVELIGSEMLDLLTAKDGKAGEAICSTLEEIRSGCFRDLMKDSFGGSKTEQGPSSGIHKVTMSVRDRINFLLNNYSSVSPILSEHDLIGGQLHLDTMIVEMVSRLQEKLSNMSESFPDQGLRFLFMLNNSDFIWERLQRSTWYSSSLQVHAAALFAKVEGYRESYLQASWAAVLSCLLLNPTPLCLFGKYYYPSPLPKFESEFQKMYATQKFWKVPDPVLKASLRNAITEKIIPGYTKYIEENNVTTPRISPQELEGMLQELFEG